MKKALVLNKNYLSYWLRQLRKTMELIGPMKGMGGDFSFKTIEQIHEISLDRPASIPLPKEFVFPQVEWMFEYDLPPAGRRGRESADGVRDLQNTEKRIVFGIRPCDVSAMNLIDRFYTGDFEPSYKREHPGSTFEDRFFVSRRKHTVFISIGCNDPDPTCFCNSVGTGPFLGSGFDVQLADLGDRYFVQTGSPAGERLIGPYAYLFDEAQKQDHDDQYEVMLSALAKFEKRVSLEETRQKILAGSVSDSFWEWVATRCFECGGCVYECPVCTCFNIVERPEKNDPPLLPFRKGGSGGFETGRIKGKRIRIWDTCFFKGFTRMAGGTIPAERKVLRTKRWWFHKVLYYPGQFGKFGCVGCGRCTITCPGRIDIATISQKIKVEIK